MGRGLIIFFSALLALGLMRVGLGLVSVPLGAVPVANVFLTALFIGVPIFALFAASSSPWTPRSALLFTLAGLLLHFGLFAIVRSGAMGTGWGAAIGGSVAQIGLVTWCTGLGALLATMLKDRNLLIPVSIFLVAFDVFLVLTPIGPTQQILKKAPEILPAIGLSIPKVVSAPTHGPVGTLAYVGPADLLFMGMFFVAMFRFGMRTKQTMIALIPMILGYLALTYFAGAVPLLVPIGITVLAVNFREFKLSKEEWLSTGLITLIALGLIAYGSTRPAPTVESSPRASVPSQQEPAN